MIIEKVTNIVESSGIIDEADFHIKKENLGVVFHILRSQLYGNPIAAIVREYFCNGRDENIMSGYGDKPVRITLPTQFEAQYKVRDFGRGLTGEEIKNVFISYGESSKRNTNDAVGFLGLGSKAAFSACDSFIVNSYQNGTCSSWSLYIDESQRGKAALLSKSDTDEPNGLEIVVPVNYYDISKFKQAAMDFFVYPKACPEFINLNDADKEKLIDRRNQKGVFYGDNWKLFNNSGHKSVAIQGDIAYPIGAYEWSDENRDENLSLILGQGCELFFEIGELSFAASREGLLFDERTKKVLVSRLKEVLAAITKEINDKFVNCKSLFEAKCLYHEIFDLQGQFYAYRNIVKNTLTFNGSPINNDVFATNNVTVNLCSYGKVKGRRYGSAEKIRRNVIDRIHANKNNILVINDLNLDKGLMNRIVPLIEDGVYKCVYLIEDGAKKDEWFKETGFDGPTLLLSSLPKVNLQKYYPKTSNGTPYIPVSRAKVMVLGDVNNYHRRNADYWTDATIDLTKDSGVYLPMLNYKYANKGDWYEGPDKLSNLFQLLGQAGIAIPTIYGIKMSAVAKAKANPKMVNFWEWAAKEVGDTIAQNAQNLTDYRNFYREFESECFGFDRLKPILGKLDAANPIAIFGQKLADLDKSHKWDALANLAQKFAIDIPTKLSYSDWKKDLADLKKKYPLFFRLISLSSSYSYDKEMIKELTNYVEIIDNCI